MAMDVELHVTDLRFCILWMRTAEANIPIFHSSEFKHETKGDISNKQNKRKQIQSIKPDRIN
jgi:hypothetical protein